MNTNEPEAEQLPTRCHDCGRQDTLLRCWWCEEYVCQLCQDNDATLAWEDHPGVCVCRQCGDN